MPGRASWKGFLRINRLSIPIKAFTVNQSEPEIVLHLVHRGCQQRIRQQRICPLHGLVASEEIVSGYEYAHGQYLALEPEELEALHPEGDKSITVDCFVAEQQIDPLQHSGRSYYLVPDEPVSQRPFCVLREGMRELQRQALARVVISRKELLVALRPRGRLLAMTVLEYTQLLRSACDYEGEVEPLIPGPAEQALIRQLIDSMTENQVEWERYRDAYYEGLHQLIEQKLAARDVGENVPQTPAPEDDAELVAALRASLAAAGVAAVLPPSPPNRSRPQGVEDMPPARKLG